MVETIITGIASFISTSIDDLLVTAIFFAQSRSKKDNVSIFLGKYLGTGILIALGCLGAFGMSFIPTQFIGLLGFIPIALGIKEFLSNKKESECEEHQTDKSKGLILNVTIVSIANGADNIGVYIPLFAGYEWTDLFLICAVYAVMIAVWSCFAIMLTRSHQLRNLIEQHKQIIIPVVYVVLGCYILAKSYLF